MKTHHLSCLLFSLLLLPLAGCDSSSNSKDDEEKGPFGNRSGAEVTVSGALRGTFNGTSSFNIVRGEGMTMSISLDDEMGSIFIVFIGDGLTTDTFPISPTDTGGKYFTVVATIKPTEGENQDTPLSITLSSGSFTITTTNNERLVGNFSGSGTIAGSDESVQIEATFAANCLFLCG